MAFQGDARNRRNILQGLQQTKSRLQRLHSDRLYPYPVPHQRGSQSPVFSQSSTAGLSLPGPGAGMMAAASRMSTSPSECSSQLQQQKLLMHQSSAQSFSFFLPQHSLHGNLIMPVLPRFNSDGQLDTSVS